MVLSDKYKNKKEHVAIEFDGKAQKELAKLDQEIQRRIVAGLDLLSQSENPRLFGKGLTANMSGLWRCRVGDYRIICEIANEKLCIFINFFAVSY